MASYLYDQAAFDMMKETSVLINTSRGGIINQVKWDYLVGNT